MQGASGESRFDGPWSGQSSWSGAWAKPFSTVLAFLSDGTDLLTTIGTILHLLHCQRLGDNRLQCQGLLDCRWLCRRNGESALTGRTSNASASHVIRGVKLLVTVGALKLHLDPPQRKLTIGDIILSLRCQENRQPVKRFRTREQLWPPKPKELLMATSTVASRAWLGT